MSAANTSTFLYVTFIKTTPAALWQALTQPAFIERFWYGVQAKSDFKAGSPWSLTLPDGRLADTGEILEAEPEKRLVIKWKNEFMPELAAEGFSRCAFDLEAAEGGTVKLTVTHSIDVADSGLIKAVSGGWPGILSNLKTLLETGKTFAEG